MPYKECQENAFITWAVRPRIHHHHSLLSHVKVFTYDIFGNFEKGVLKGLLPTFLTLSSMVHGLLLVSSAPIVSVTLNRQQIISKLNICRFSKDQLGFVRMSTSDFGFIRASQQCFLSDVFCRGKWG